MQFDQMNSIQRGDIIKSYAASAAMQAACGNETRSSFQLIDADADIGVEVRYVASERFCVGLVVDGRRLTSHSFDSMDDFDRRIDGVSYEMAKEYAACHA